MQGVRFGSHHFVPPLDPFELLFPLLCAVTTCVCAAISVIVPSRPKVYSQGLFPFRHRTPLWLMQVSLILLRVLLAFNLHEIYSWNLLIHASILLSVVFDNCNCADAPLKVRCWTVLYGLVFLFTLQQLATEPLTTLRVLAAFTSLFSLSCSILRSIYAFEELHPSPPSEEYTASLPFYLLYAYLSRSLIWPSLWKPAIQEEDVPHLFEHDLCRYLWSIYNHRRKKESSLALNVLRVVWYPICVQVFFAVLSCCFVFVAPLALRRILWCVSNDCSASSSSFDTIASLIALVLGPLLCDLFDNINYAHGRHVGIRIRSILCCVCYEKLLKLDGNLFADGAGRVSNLINTDVKNVLYFVCYSPMLLTNFIEIVICILLLYYVLGPAAFGGVAIMFLALPTGYFVSERLRILYKRLSSYTDTRLNTVSEILQGIRIIKLFAWEGQFTSKIFASRGIEVEGLKSYVFTKAALSSLWSVVLPLVAMTSFLVHTLLLGNSLSPATGFTALTLFSILKFPLSDLPDTVNGMLRAYTSVRRIEAFLNAAEVSGMSYLPPSSSEDAVITIKSADISWKRPQAVSGSDSDEGLESFSCCEQPYHLLVADESDASMRDIESHLILNEAEVPSVRTVLSNVTLAVQKGTLVVVIGMTGAGKSSLINGLLGESLVSGGDLQMKGMMRLSYVPQSPFIQSGSLRDNILFGEAFETSRYNAVIYACALHVDIAYLPLGDLTELGEKGVNLSGGQQQRVCLARAAYASSDIILLDDPLSAVDAHVADHIFRELICKFLIHRTIVLVSHQIPLTVPMADTVLYVDRLEGSVLQCSPKDLLHQLHVPDSNQESHHFLAMVREASMASARNSSPPSCDKSKDTSVIQRSCSIRSADNFSAAGDSANIIEMETKAEGTVRWKVYQYYVDACGGFRIAAVLLLLAVGVSFVDLFQNVLLGRWMSQMEAGDPNSALTLRYYLLSLAAAVGMKVGKSFAQAAVGIYAALRLHNTMTLRVLRSPLWWFESTPLGRIMNRFSQDVQTVDTDVMNSLISFADTILGTLQILLVISCTLPFLLPFMIPVILVTGWVGHQYLTVSRELKRLESISRSPVLVHFSESFIGLTTLRAFGKQNLYFENLCHKVDNLNRMHLYLWLSNRWLNIRMCILGAVVAGAVGLTIVYGKSVEASMAGLTLLYTLTFTENLTWIARKHAEVQMDLNSVERMMEYSSIPQEKYLADSSVSMTTSRNGLHAKEEIHVLKSEDSFASLPSSSLMEVEDSWPSTGDVEFRNITLSYRTNAYVLRDVSFRVAGGKKVGVVGRTGAGKSSLITALFRLVEPVSGAIIVDGKNLLELPLQLLRSKISIVPQEPVLFQGSVRSNLDPFDKFPDEVLWHALRAVKMDDLVASLPGGNSLSDKMITEKGGNLSVGQRQLLCLARAMVRKEKVLVMDEATASVDHETDALIQETIRHHIRDCTVFCVAHRLHTVAFYDQVIVMDGGTVAETGSPLELILRENSLFRSMCISSGDYDNLLSIAKGL